MRVWGCDSATKVIVTTLLLAWALCCILLVNKLPLGKKVRKHPFHCIITGFHHCEELQYGYSVFHIARPLDRETRMGVLP